MVFATDNAECRNLARFVDSVGADTFEVDADDAAVGGNEIVEVIHDSVLPDESDRIVSAGKPGAADDLARAVDAGGDTDGPAKGAEIKGVSTREARGVVVTRTRKN